MPTVIRVCSFIITRFDRRFIRFSGFTCRDFRTARYLCGYNSESERERFFTEHPSINRPHHSLMYNKRGRNTNMFISKFPSEPPFSKSTCIYTRCTWLFAKIWSNILRFLYSEILITFNCDFVIRRTILGQFVRCIDQRYSLDKNIVGTTWLRDI